MDLANWPYSITPKDPVVSKWDNHVVFGASIGKLSEKLFKRSLLGNIAKTESVLKESGSSWI